MVSERYSLGTFINQYPLSRTQKSKEIIFSLLLNTVRDLWVESPKGFESSPLSFKN